MSAEGKKIDDIERAGSDALKRLKPFKKKAGVSDTYNEIITKFWDRFGIIKVIPFRGSDLAIVNDHARGLTLLTEVHRTMFDLSNLLETQYSKKKFREAREERLAWIKQMMQSLTSLVGQLELRVNNGDPKRAKENALVDIPELPISMETPLLLLEEKFSRKQYHEDVEKLLRISPNIQDLHGLILTLQQKHVDNAVCLLTFGDWIGKAIHSCQESKEYHHLKEVMTILQVAFDSATCASWGALRRIYGVDLCPKPFLYKSRKLTRVCTCSDEKDQRQLDEVKEEKEPDMKVETKDSTSPPATFSPSQTAKSSENKLELDIKNSTDSKIEEPAMLGALSSTSPPSTTTPHKRNLSLEKPQPARVCQWKKHLDPNTGRYYFYHTPTGKSQWTQPPDYFDPPKTSARGQPSLVSSMSPGAGTPVTDRRSLKNRSINKGSTISMKIG